MPSRAPRPTMHAEHATLLKELRTAARPTSGARQHNDSYSGSGRPFLNVAVPDRRAIIKRWLTRHKTMVGAEVLPIVDSLFCGEAHEEKTMGALLIAAHANARAQVDPARLDRWLGQLNGWAEIDCLCQNVFTAAEMTSPFAPWRRLLEQLCRDPNINKRRAALVLLVGPVHYCDDARLRDLAFKIIERLKSERAILITKAVSWLLRSLITQHRDAVTNYLALQGHSLPRIAVRETRTKLSTGTKSGRV